MPGVQRKIVTVVLQRKISTLEMDLQLAGFQNISILIFKDGEQNLVLQFVLHRLPINVKKSGEGR